MIRVSRYSVVVLAIATLYAGLHWGSTTAGGADSYGYVSQAALWRSGHLAIQQDIVRPSPWPNAADTWAPLGYRASPDRRDSIVPLYSPGLPMLMALFQAVGGFCAAFIVVPVCGALTVWLTYVFGERVFANPAISAAAAILVATSPIFLYQLMNPMSDVPVTAAWTLALVLAMAEWPGAAGLAAGLAILIRPNLAPLALVSIAWLMVTRRGAARFTLGLAPAIAAVAAINTATYGSPLLSGYGTLGDLYAIAHWKTNARQFARWLVETQTPFVVLPVLYFAAPRMFRDARIPHPRLLLGGTVVTIALSYLFYVPFDAWWYLRFLLPMWPIVMLLTAASFDAIVWMVPRRWRDAIVLAFALALAVNGVRAAADRYAFEVGRAERRYIDVARFVASHTDSNAVMISLQHSGTLRMYADRLTLRFDQLDPEWVDRAIVFLRDNGRHPYFVLEGNEAELFRKRFGGSSAAGRLDWGPIARLADANVTIYDALERRAGVEPLAIGAAASRRAGWRCDTPVGW